MDAASVPHRPRSRRRLRQILLASVGIGSLVLLAPELADVYRQLGDLGAVRWPWVAAAVASEGVSFVACWTVLRIVLRRRDWFGVATSQLAGNSVSQVVPAGAAPGAAVQVRMLLRTGSELPNVLAGLAASGVLSSASFLALPLIALPAIWSGAHVDSTMEAGVWLSVVLLVGLAGVVVIGTRDRVVVRAASAVERVLGWIIRGRGPQDLGRLALEQRDLLHRTVRAQGGRAVTAAFVQALGGFGVLYFAVLASGAHTGITVVVATFVVANLAAMVPFTPGGVGFVEAGAASVLVFGGVAAAPALVAVALYRVVYSWLPIATGGVAYLAFTRRIPSIVEVDVREALPRELVPTASI